MPLRLVPKSTTLDDLEWPICTLLQKRCVFRSPPQKNWIKMDPYYGGKMCANDSSSAGIRSMRIFAEVPWGGGVKRQWGCRERQFSAFCFRWLFFGYFRDEVSGGYTQSVVGFSVIPKCMTLNDLQFEGHSRSCIFNGYFAPVWLAETYDFRKIVAWKLIKIDTYCQRFKSSAGTLVSTFVRIFARVLCQRTVRSQHT